MSVIKLYSNGVTCGNAGYIKDSDREKRSIVEGWTKKSSTGLRKFLYSVDYKNLPSVGYAFTLTLRTCPETSDDWHRIVKNYSKRLKRMGYKHFQWLTEWQARGVPHLHGVVFFEKEPRYPQEIVFHWLDLTKQYETLAKSQDYKPIYDVGGWLNYLAKHASRGVSHYQRSNANMPKGWKKTGRLWAASRNFPKKEILEFEIPLKAMHQHRRIVKNLEISRIRQKLKDATIHACSTPQGGACACILHNKNHTYTPTELNLFINNLNNRKSIKKWLKSVKYGRQGLEKKLSTMLGSSNWLDQDQSFEIIRHLAKTHKIINKNTGELLQ